MVGARVSPAHPSIGSIRVTERAIRISHFRPIRPADGRAYNSPVRAFLRTLWDEPAVADPPRRVWRDWVLVSVLLALATVEVIVRSDITYRWASFALALGTIPPLLWRRTHPLLAVCLVFGAHIVADIPWIAQGADGTAPGLYSAGFVLVLPYALFRWGSGRHGLIGLGVMLTAALISAIWDYTNLSEAVTGFAVFFGTIALGLAMRYRTRARISKLDAVRARERENLARDLHDTVAHHVSAIAIRAQAGLAVAPTDPGAAADALRVIDAEASRTLAEMRTIVRGLRQGEEADLARKLDDMPIPASFGFVGLRGLSYESQEKLDRVRPTTVGQASRIPGVRPSDIALVIGHLRGALTR